MQLRLRLPMWEINTYLLIMEVDCRVDISIPSLRHQTQRWQAQYHVLGAAWQAVSGAKPCKTRHISSEWDLLKAQFSVHANVREHADSK